MTHPPPDVAPAPGGARFVLRVDDDGSGELQVELAPGMATQVVLPARLVRAVLVLFFAAVEARVNPEMSQTQPSWRVGRPTLTQFAAKLALLAGEATPMQVDGAATYLRLVNQRVRTAVKQAWPGRAAPRLVEQRSGGRLAAPLTVPGLRLDPPQPVLAEYARRYVKTLATPSLEGAFQHGLKENP